MSIDRQGVMLHHEGQLIQMAGNMGKAGAAEYARANIDGCFNALVRLEEPKDVAAFAFALTDRVVGQMKVPTAWPLIKIGQQPMSAEALKAVADAGPGLVVLPSAPAPVPPPRQYSYWTIFTIGWSLGVLVTAWITLSPFVARLLAGGVR
jgi:hypothetical protein